MKFEVGAVGASFHRRRKFSEIKWLAWGHTQPEVIEPRSDLKTLTPRPVFPAQSSCHLRDHLVPFLPQPWLMNPTGEFLTQG